MSDFMYYMAILAPEEIDRQVQVHKLYMKDQYHCVVALRSPAHITLVPPFWQPESAEPGLKQFLATQAKKYPSFPIQLAGFGCFRPRVIFVAVTLNPALARMHDEIREASLQIPEWKLRPDERPFQPHITIANRDLSKRDFYSAWARFSEQEFQAEFIANRLSLLRLEEGRWQAIAESDFSG